MTVAGSNIPAAQMGDCFIARPRFGSDGIARRGSDF